MPHLASHYFYAMSIYDKLDTDLKKQLIDHLEEYIIGAQGLDVFFFSYSPSVRHYGTTMHKQEASLIIKPALDKVKLYNSKIGKAYLFGLITHFAFDYLIHPIVHKQTYNFDTHMILEKELDAKLIERFTSYQAYLFKRHQLLNYDNLYFHSFFKLIYPDLTSMQVYDSIQNMYHFFKMMYTPKSIKKDILSYLSSTNLPIPYDFSHLMINKDDKKMFDKEVDAIINNYEQYVDFGLKLFYNANNYLQGKADLDPIFSNNYSGHLVKHPSNDKSIL